MPDKHVLFVSDIHKMTNKNEQKGEVAKREEEVLAFWQEEDIFKKSLEKDSPKGDFVFYDGPPFATGLPHVGNLLSSVVKDAVGRYWTMKGYHVERRWGWDCHGLPIENQIEKDLGLKNKKEIYELGIDKFNEACKSTVLRYADEWKEYVSRIGRWTDYDGAYKTMDNTYMESVWWFVSEIYKKGLLYEGRKVLLYCPHCETPLSKAEIAMDNSYKDITEESVYVKFKVKEPEKHNLPSNSYLVAWTTTPWTLPGNVALAVGEAVEYQLVKTDEENLLIAKDLLSAVFADDQTETQTEVVLKGKDLVGLNYEPLYEIDKVQAENKPNAFTVLPADFVTTEEGTGIVHTAVIYGEDDYELGLQQDLPMVPLLDQVGHFNEAAPAFIKGQYFKKAEKGIKEDLEERGLMLSRKDHTHSYPHCYRCGTALLYNALVSWFVDIQKVKNKLIKTNEDIQWYPEHLKHGRYKHILENAPDWTISRNRFWATALPIWKNEKTGECKVFGSVDELSEYVPKSGNTYLLMRHGQSTSNLKGVISANKENDDPLTDVGKEEVKAAMKELPKDLDIIIHSGFKRTKETAELIAEGSQVEVVEDDRVRELDLYDEYEGHPWSKYGDEFKTWKDRYTKELPGSENRRDAQKRMGAFIYDLEERYKDKKVLIVSHAGPLFALECAAYGLDVEGSERHYRETNFFKNAEVRQLPFVSLSHNQNYELDLHRPYIDDLPVVDKDGERLVRIPEVIDVWAESGSMPFAAKHYPHSNQEEFKKAFPADFIAEYIAQTRTWFYYMHTVSLLLFGKPSFKNVVSTGNILAEDGTKMSKSKRNFTDPMVNINQFGVDAMRYYLMSGVVMQSEDMSFKDEELREMHNRVVNILWNTFCFYELYKHEETDQIKPQASKNILDQWILARLNSLVTEVSKHMDSYDFTRATRPLRQFVEDFSTWYVRRSRDRFKSVDEVDKQAALSTTKFVLVTFAKVIAPVMPFIAESVYRGAGGEKESVHLEEWPDGEKFDEKILETMAKTREIVSLALEARAKSKIKVRQPLQKLVVKSDSAALYEPYVSLILDEVNVKEVVFDNKIEEEVWLDVELTPELQREGDVREFIRSVQQERKQRGLKQSDQVTLLVDKSLNEVIAPDMEEVKRVVGATAVEVSEFQSEEEKISCKLSDQVHSFKVKSV